jgi:hypothetical protein
MTTFTPQLTTTNADGTEKNSPKPENSGDVTTSGQPSTAPTAAGSLKNTTLDKMNNSLAHVCDIAGPMAYGIAWAKFKIGEAIQAIRTFLEGLWSSTANSPFGDAIRGAINYIKAKITLVKKFIRDVNEAVAAVQKFVNEMMELVVLIATYPAKIAAALIGCIKEATANIALSEENKKLLETATKSGSAKVATDAVTTTQKSLTETESSSSSTIVPQFQIA